jgi:hypothetical protein
MGVGLSVKAFFAFGQELQFISEVDTVELIVFTAVH